MDEHDNLIKAISGSYRDPYGHVFCSAGKIFRTVSSIGLKDYLFCKKSGYSDEATSRGWIVKTRDILDPKLKARFPDHAILLEHDTIPFVSFPYEWTFSQLRKAALLTIDLHLLALKYGVTMRDSSAYNIQFLGTSPVFIDYLSFGIYEEGQIWTGHHQFCEQFLNPLLLYAKIGLEYQKWYRGAMSGISTRDTARILPRKSRLSPHILVHVFLKNRMDNAAVARFANPGSGQAFSVDKKQVKMPLPKRALVNMLTGMRSLIAGLKMPSQKSLWQDYAHINSYDMESTAAKRQFVEEICAAAKPDRVLDIGCNTGEYTEIALTSGTNQAVGLDMDHGALTRAFAMAEEKSLPLLPLFQDLQNLSPAQGWKEQERPSLSKRIMDWKPDLVLALAIVHHLALAGNVPLKKILSWITGLAPTGIIEFVPKSDVTVQIMLRHREEIFCSYTQRDFETLLQERAQITRQVSLSNGRALYAFSR